MPFPLIVVGAAVIGLVGRRVAPAAFEPEGDGSVDEDESILGDAFDERAPRGSWRRTFKVLLVGLTTWWARCSS